MKPSLDLEGLQRTKAWEYLLRFVFGGLVTACAGFVTHAWGPAIGGLFLGFPAILPASLTLVKEHDGRAQAADDARGGGLGSVSLAGFALIVWALACVAPIAVVLGIAAVAWLAAGAGLWWFLDGHHRRR